MSEPFQDTSIADITAVLQDYFDGLYEGDLDKFLDRQWVLGKGGDGADELVDEEVEAVKTEYFRQYITAWRTFIDSVYIDAPNNADKVLASLLMQAAAEPRFLA